MGAFGAALIARERYEDYFDRFFRNGGEWEKFVTGDDASEASEEK